MLFYDVYKFYVNFKQTHSEPARSCLGRAACSRGRRSCRYNGDEKRADFKAADNRSVRVGIIHEGSGRDVAFRHRCRARDKEIVPLQPLSEPRGNRLRRAFVLRRPSLRADSALARRGSRAFLRFPFCLRARVVRGFRLGAACRGGVPRRVGEIFRRRGVFRVEPLQGRDGRRAFSRARCPRGGICRSALPDAGRLRLGRKDDGAPRLRN